MRRYLPYILTGILFTLTLVFFPVNTAEANCNLIAGFNLNACVTDIFAEISNQLLRISSWVLTLAGFILNFSINLTLHIKEFVDNTPAIYTVWKAIRDISGMFIIFILIFAAIKMILSPFGLNPKMGEVVKTVVMAGILINFSFFITGLGIDVSNVVSIQLYNAIAPVNNLTGKPTEGAGIQASLDGGISNIMMNSLRIPAISDLKAADRKTSNIPVDNPIKVILAGVIGVMIMLTTAISFFLAALAFIVRFVILIVLLGFSPILFAGLAIPQLSKYGNQWKELYTGQLLFMPVYLLLMYFALSVLSSSALFKPGGLDRVVSGDIPFSNLLVLGINAAIVIIMINIPLLAALSLGAKMPGWASKVDGFSMWKKLGGMAGRNTLGLAANRINESERARKFYANNPNFGSTVSKGLSKVSSGGFGGKKGGYDAALKAQKKDMDDLNKRIGTVNPANYASDAERKAAKKEAEAYQEKFRKVLPNKSLMTFMMKNRGNTEVGHKLNEEANKKAERAIAEMEAKQAQSEINAHNQAIKLLKESQSQSAVKNAAQKAEQTQSIDTQIGELRKKAAEHREKSGNVMPAFAGEYKKKAEEFEARANELEKTKQSIASAPLSSEATDKDIERLENHISSLEKKRSEANAKIAELKNKDKEKDWEKLAKVLKDDLKKDDGGDKPKTT